MQLGASAGLQYCEYESLTVTNTSIVSGCNYWMQTPGLMSLIVSGVSIIIPPFGIIFQLSAVLSHWRSGNWDSVPRNPGIKITSERVPVIAPD